MGKVMYDNQSFDAWVDKVKTNVRIQDDIDSVTLEGTRAASELYGMSKQEYRALRKTTGENYGKLQTK